MSAPIKGCVLYDRVVAGQKAGSRTRRQVVVYSPHKQFKVEQINDWDVDSSSSSRFVSSLLYLTTKAFIVKGCVIFYH